MKLALLSDLHANRHALDACLDDARLRGTTQYAFLGDLVGYGADPGVVVDRVMAMADQGAWVLRGNHDDLAVAPSLDISRADRAGAPWTHAHLNKAQLDFLAKLPLVLRHEFMFLVHGSAREPERWHYVQEGIGAAVSLEAACTGGVTHVFGGHVHEQRLFFQGAARAVMPFEPTPGVPIPVLSHRRWLATVGSVGQPRDGQADAMYALFDSVALQLTFVRVPYDHEAAARAIRRAGLPEFNAARLASGQ